MTSRFRTGNAILLALAASAAFVLNPAPALADVVTVKGSLDANFSDPTGTGTFTTQSTPTNGLDIRQFVGSAPNFENRSVVLFSLPAGVIPANAMIQSVTFNFQANVVTGNVGRTVGLLGYTGGSNLTLADATAAATQLATYDNVALGLGNQSVGLGSAGVTLLRSLVGQNKTLGLRIQGTTYGTNTALSSIEQANAVPTAFNAPSITITFTPAAVPEPSVLALAGTGALVVLGVSRLRRGRAS